MAYSQGVKNQVVAKEFPDFFGKFKAYSTVPTNLPQNEKRKEETEYYCNPDSVFNFFLFNTIL